MNGSGKRHLLKLFQLLLILIFPLGYLHAQDSLRLNVESRLFEVSQEIPGLSFVLQVKEYDKDLSVFDLNRSAENGIAVFQSREVLLHGAHPPARRLHDDLRVHPAR